MALIAVTDISHGRVADGGEVEQYYFNAGDEVDESVFTEEQVEDLKKMGSVEESKRLEEVNDLRKQVEELQAKLAEMESEAAGKDNLVTGARAVDQTALDPQAGVPAGTIIDEKTGKPVDDKTQSTPKTNPASKPSTPAK